MTIHELDASGLAYHREQLSKLEADREPLWGEMDALRMIAHLRRVLQVSLGEAEERSEAMVPSWIGRIVGWLFFDVFTRWPPARRGNNPAPEMFPVAAHGFEEERRLLVEALERFVERSENAPEERHMNPVLGLIPLKRWARVHGVHYEHHYRQFGLVP